MYNKIPKLMYRK